VDDEGSIWRKASGSIDPSSRQSVDHPDHVVILAGRGVRLRLPPVFRVVRIQSGTNSARSIAEAQKAFSKTVWEIGLERFASFNASMWFAADAKTNGFDVKRYPALPLQVGKDSEQVRCCRVAFSAEHAH
jgi:hypothetical protein